MEELSLRKIVLEWGPEFESSFQQKDAMSFSHTNFCSDPDSSKCVTGIWNWTKRHLLDLELQTGTTDCSYLSLNEKPEEMGHASTDVT